MGITYDGPYADDVHHDAHHEGYAGRLMPDGTLASSWGGAKGSTGHSGLIGACECGWRADTVHEPGDLDSPAYHRAENDVEALHIAPLVAAAKQRFWPSWAERSTARIHQIATRAQQGRLGDAKDLNDELRFDINRRTVILAELLTAQEWADTVEDRVAEQLNSHDPQGRPFVPIATPAAAPAPGGPPPATDQTPHRSR